MITFKTSNHLRLLLFECNFLEFKGNNKQTQSTVLLFPCFCPKYLAGHNKHLFGYLVPAFYQFVLSFRNE